jgi:hypothetical protein
MSQHEGVTCELCKSAASFVMSTSNDPNGKRVDWPKATTRADGI